MILDLVDFDWRDFPEQGEGGREGAVEGERGEEGRWWRGGRMADVALLMMWSMRWQDM